MIRKPLSFLVIPLALSLASCGPKAATKTAEEAPAKTEVNQPEKTQAVANAEETSEKKEVPAEEKPVMAETTFPEAVDIAGFGSDEPLERKDMPSRGIIVMGPDSWDHSNGAHWETYTGTKFKAKRWGRYQVRLTYTLNRAALGMQFRMGELVVKKSLSSSPKPRKTYLGDLYIPQPGDVPFSLLTPPTEDASFTIHEIALIPTCEGEMPKQAEDGSILLEAKNAITWSENMRYEPKPEKNCLGFWTSEEDLAEWEFEVAQPGRYKVTVSHGCGGGNHGSEVEVKHADQTLKFTTQDTGGFQNWQDVPLGEIEIKAPGKQRLQINPVNKVKSAVLDVQKVVLTPVG
ncbi:hypothetical protein WJU23_20290 [Prosthecobacter sp. SYSU 5D2]|uniref:DUF5077 domain-containing protein n=1 Tax=Prosthecobacter sp. SYSU 5D2 TaxID=3134134 RepID=UPI0031FEB0F8